MFSQTFGEVTHGVDGIRIVVEVDVSNSLPTFDIVGLPALAIKESKERVRAAIRNSDIPFPDGKITVNLAPADIKKEGSGLDLPIALGVLTSGQFLPAELSAGKTFIGELSLEGRIRKVSGVISMIMDAKEHGCKEIFIPKENALEGQLISGIDTYAVSCLQEVVDHLVGNIQLQPLAKISIAKEESYVYKEDFADIKGQKTARRALEIAAAGGHSLLMVGSPGCGKTMLARRLVTILPPMTEEEALEVTKIYSISNLLPEEGRIITERPFRSPHHSISSNALLGGGSIPRPGEVTLAHNGVLFLDEMPEFQRHTLEMLRQPLEDGMVNISRVKAALSFPSKFVLCAAQNPCPCGFLGDKLRTCTCKQSAIESYQRKISGPLLDRIDMQLNLQRVSYDEFNEKGMGESSAVIRRRVVKARNIQLKRLEGTGLYSNSQMGRKEVARFCRLTLDAQQALERYFSILHLSARSHDRLLKVARTIADLEECKLITSKHLAEAVSLRTSMIKG